MLKVYANYSSDDHTKKLAIEKEDVLFEGSWTFNQVKSFTQDLTVYDRFRFYCSNGDIKEYNKLDAGIAFVTTSNYSVDFVYIVRTIITKSGTNYTYSSRGILTFNTSGAMNYGDMTYSVTITKIVGIRK